MGSSRSFPSSHKSLWSGCLGKFEEKRGVASSSVLHDALHIGVVTSRSSSSPCTPPPRTPSKSPSASSSGGNSTRYDPSASQSHMVSQDPVRNELRRGSGAWVVECLRFGGRIQSFEGMPLSTVRLGLSYWNGHVCCSHRNAPRPEAVCTCRILLPSLRSLLSAGEWALHWLLLESGRYCERRITAWRSGLSGYRTECPGTDAPYKYINRGLATAHWISVSCRPIEVESDTIAQGAMGILLGQRGVLRLSQQFFCPTTHTFFVPEFKRVTRATSQGASGKNLDICWLRDRAPSDIVLKGAVDFCSLYPNLFT